MPDQVQIKTALISVSDKTDLLPFARRLVSYGVKLISTGGTAKKLAEAGLDVTPIEELTGFPEMMDGRVKTLHPRVHGGLLALRDKPDHAAAMAEHGIDAIDLVCVNLYPFEQTISREGVAYSEAIEQIDIGGPSMIRSAAKNHSYVAVVTSPNQYDMVGNALDEHDGKLPLQLRRRLAQAAFTRTASYDTAISQWMAQQEGAGVPTFPGSLLMRMEKSPIELRYGENPHQQAALYLDPDAKRTSEPDIAHARQLHGIPLGYCNYFDADGALELVKEIDPADRAAAAIIKHANPCGFAVADSLPKAFANAYNGDPLAAFGGIVALNRRVDAATAEKICEGKKLLHVIIAPGYDDDAQQMLKDRWKNVRILEVAPITDPNQRQRSLALRQIQGGMLAQERDLVAMQPEQWEHKAGPKPSEADLEQAALAMIAVRHLKSNAVCLVRDGMLVGGGMGQVDRVASCRLAVERAGARAKGAVAGSDAFFPFNDGPQILIDAGVKVIVEPGGSQRDQDTIEVCEENGVTLLFNGRRHFRH